MQRRFATRPPPPPPPWLLWWSLWSSIAANNSYDEMPMHSITWLFSSSSMFIHLWFNATLIHRQWKLGWTASWTKPRLKLKSSHRRRADGAVGLMGCWAGWPATWYFLVLTFLIVRLMWISYLSSSKHWLEETLRNIECLAIKHWMVEWIDHGTGYIRLYITLAGLRRAEHARMMSLITSPLLSFCRWPLIVNVFLSVVPLFHCWNAGVWSARTFLTQATCTTREEI